jgi:hypothetical protein
VGSLLGEEIVEGLYRSELVFLDVENGIELGDIQNVLDLLAQVEQLKIPARIAHSGKTADQLAHAGGIDKIDVRQVEDDLLLARRNQVPYRLAQALGFVTQSDPALDVDDGDVADFARSDVHRIESEFAILGFAEW